MTAEQQLLTRTIIFSKTANYFVISLNRFLFIL